MRIVNKTIIKGCIFGAMYIFLSSWKCVMWTIWELDMCHCPQQQSLSVWYKRVLCDAQQCLSIEKMIFFRVKDVIYPIYEYLKLHSIYIICIISMYKRILE